MSEVLSHKPRSILSPKVPPHSNEAEQSVIGGLLLDGNAWDKIVGIINETDFYRPEHKVIFRTVEHLIKREQPVDVLTLTVALKEINELENSGGEVYLFELAKNTPSAANILAYAEIVRERSVLRQLINIGQEITESAFNSGGRQSVEILDDAERKVFAIAEQNSRGSGPVEMRNILAQTIEKIDTLYRNQDAITGLATGFADIDEMTSGLQKSDLIIIAGRPSMGKTVLGINIAENVAISLKKPTLIFSMEMPADAIAMRMLSSLGHINQHKIRTGKLTDQDWPRITSGVSMLSEAPIYVDDTPALSPAEVRARARRVAKETKGLGLIVLDYLQLMQIPGYGDNRVGEISEISRSLKALARELNIPVIALSQLNRSLEQRPNKRPIMADLRESGAIEQDADLIAFIYRDEVYNPETPEKGVAEIIIGKHRNGPIGTVRLTFLGQFTKFENFSSRDDMNSGMGYSASTFQAPSE